MGNHPNRNWRKRWSYDEATRTAQHESGFTVVFNEYFLPVQIQHGEYEQDQTIADIHQQIDRLVHESMRYVQRVAEL